MSGQERRGNSFSNGPGMPKWLAADWQLAEILRDRQNRFSLA